MDLGMDRGRAPGENLLSLHAAGLPGGSGMVAADSTVHTDPDAGGRVDDLGRHQIIDHTQGTGDLDPIPGVVTRPMVGGVRVAPHSRLLVDAPAFAGGHLEILGRRSTAVMTQAELQAPDPTPTRPGIRVPPVSDPMNRTCSNIPKAGQ